ncbi:MAG: hypothetical protein R3283_05500, partial [Balneolaceae bacterium]|nr:hypothetical protein [Balneolaceae bacterium]
MVALFPFWLFIAYKFEWTPDGFQKTPDSAAPESSEGAAHKKSYKFIIAGLVVALLLMISDRIFNLTGSDITPDPPELKSVTTSRSYNYSNSWSPDGSMMTYSEFRSSFDLMIMTPEVSSSERRLTDHPADELIPRWSPDGTKIAFVSDKGAGVKVYWISPSGGPERAIASTNMHSLEHFYEFFTSLGSTPWLPNGEKLIYSKLEENTISLWELNINSGEEQRVTNPRPGQRDLGASVSKDGSKIVFQRDANIWLKEDNGPEFELISDPYVNFQPIWSQNGEKVIFSSDRSGSRNLWEYSLNDQSFTQITFYGPAYAVWDPSLSSEGRLTFTEFTHETDLIYINLVENQERRLT